MKKGIFGEPLYSRDELDKWVGVTPVEDDNVGIEFWEFMLEQAIERLLQCSKISKTISDEHTKDTPARVVKAFKEYFMGCTKDPALELTTGFKEETYDQMVFVNDISFTSFCAHHLVPFAGRVHFAYIPQGKVVGLSKIPRMILTLAARPQLQEKLTQEIANCFFDNIEPKGCGVVVEAYHLCMCARGVKQQDAYTRTTALKGDFMNPSTKQEFLDGAKRGNGIWL